MANGQLKRMRVKLRYLVLTWIQIHRVNSYPHSKLSNVKYLVKFLKMFGKFKKTVQRLKPVLKIGSLTHVVLTTTRLIPLRLVVQIRLMIISLLVMKFSIKARMLKKSVLMFCKSRIPKTLHQMTVLLLRYAA